MWMKLICLVIMFMAIPGIKGEIPLAFTPAAISGGQSDTLTVKNYDTGSVMTESYTDVEHLNRDTQVRTGAYANSADAASPRGGLEASISSNVIGYVFSWLVLWLAFGDNPILFVSMLPAPS